MLFTVICDKIEINMELKEKKMLEIAICFIIGLILYYFLNEVIYKLPIQYFAKQQEEFEPIKAGKVRKTGVALWGGLSTIFIYWNCGFTFKALTILIFYMVITVITFIDFDTMEIPPILNIIVFVIGVLSIWTIGEPAILDRIIGMFAISLPLFLIVLIVPGGFGGGDIKLMFAAGLFLGWKATVVSFFVGLMIAAVYGVVLMIRRRMGRKDHFAFGPFLCLGMAIGVFYGNQLMDMYLSTIIG